MSIIASIQRGSQLLGVGEAFKIITITNVNIAKAHAHWNSASSQSSAQVNAGMARLVLFHNSTFNTTELWFYRGDSPSNCYVDWEVIEYT